MAIKKSKKNKDEEAAPARQPAPPPAVLEPIDEKIIAALRQSGRIANRDLARLIDVNEATVRTRLRKLEATNAVRVVAMEHGTIAEEGPHARLLAEGGLYARLHSMQFRGG